MIPDRLSTHGLGVLLAAYAVASLASPSAGREDIRTEKRVGATTDVVGALEIERPHAVFDDSYQHSSIRHEFTILNTGQESVLIEAGVALDESGSVLLGTAQLNPGESTLAKVLQPLGSHLGQSTFRYALVTDEPGVSRYRFSLAGFVESAYDPERPTLRFGTVHRDLGAKIGMDLASREVESLALVAVESDVSYLSAAVDGRGDSLGQSARVTATLAPGAPKGLLSGRLTVLTNVEQQNRLQVVWTASVFGDLWASENPINVGQVEVGAFSRGETTVRLQNQSGEPVRIERVESDQAAIRVETRSCDEMSNQKASCELLVLHTMPAQPGVLTGTIEVWTLNDPDPLPLRYYGIAVSPGTVVRAIDLTSEEQP